MHATRLIIVRHGHTGGNEEGLGVRIAGWTDLPLSQLGWEQARALARRFAAASPAAAIVSSPLRRAVDTARALAAPHLGPLLLDEGLREIHCGEVDGMPMGEAQARYPGAWAANLRQDDEDFGWPGGETYRAFRARCLAAVERVAAEHAGERVVVVTHAGVISQVLGFLHGRIAAEWESFRPGNGSVTELAWEAGRGTLVRFDDRSHLDGVSAAPERPERAGAPRD